MMRKQFISLREFICLTIAEDTIYQIGLRQILLSLSLKEALIAAVVKKLRRVNAGLLPR